MICKMMFKARNHSTTHNVKLDNLYLFVPCFLPTPNTQVLFNESIKNTFALSFNALTADTRVISTGSDYQVHIESSDKINCPTDLIAEHQTAARSGFVNKTINVSVFDHVVVT